jgi:hypothetical protein
MLEYGEIAGPTNKNDNFNTHPSPVLEDFRV